MLDANIIASYQFNKLRNKPIKLKNHLTTTTNETFFIVRSLKLRFYTCPGSTCRFFRFSSYSIRSFILLSFLSFLNRLASFSEYFIQFEYVKEGFIRLRSSRLLANAWEASRERCCFWREKLGISTHIERIVNWLCTWDRLMSIYEITRIFVYCIVYGIGAQWGEQQLLIAWAIKFYDRIILDFITYNRVPNIGCV